MSRIRFEDTTPINKSNLNKLNNVVISGAEPTTGEEVWIQKGKNLLNLLKCKISNASSNYNVDNANKITVTSNWGWGFAQIDDFEVIVGKEYVISCNFTNSLNINTGIIVYNNNGDTLNHQSFVATNGNLEIRFTPNTEKVKIRFAANNTPDNHNNTVVYDNIQIEFNNKTPYEPYIDKKIFVKNGNDEYAKFYDENKKVILFEGDTNGDVPLTDNVSNYNYIEVIGTTGGGESFSSKALSTSPTITCLVVGLDASSDNLGFVLGAKHLSVEGNLLRVKAAGRMFKYMVGDVVVDNNNQTFVKRVIGYKNK